MKRVHNFSAGPAALPTEVLKKVREELLDYHGQGTSIMEQSHRGESYTKVDESAKVRLNRLLGLDNKFKILFLQGGASTQFMQVPFNFLKKEETADIINTGIWSKKAIKEARLFGNIHIGYSGEENNFSRVPSQEDLQLSKQPRYVHFTSNNTIYGTQFPIEPETNGVPLVCDASSDFLSHSIQVDKYGLIYAGAQKNLGPSGVTVVLIKKDFLETADKKDMPTILNYHTHANRIFNTPPTFAVYMMELVLAWIEDKGGVPYFEKITPKKRIFFIKLLMRMISFRGWQRKIPAQK